MAHHVFERDSDQQQMNRIETAVSLVIRTAFPRQLKLGERTDLRIGKLAWTTDEVIMGASNSRTSLLCRVSEIIFGKRSNKGARNLFRPDEFWDFERNEFRAPTNQSPSGGDTTLRCTGSLL